MRFGFAPLLLVLAAACADSAPMAPMSRETFIDVMVELRRAAAQDTSQAAFEASKGRILEAAGVTDSALIEYVRLNAARIEFMAEVWDSVDARLIAAPDTAI